MKLNTKQNRISTPAIIYVVCLLGILETLPTLLLYFTEIAYMAGEWYLWFLIVSSLLIWLSLIGVWKMKKWGVVAYTSIMFFKEIVLYKYNQIWHYNSLLIPIIATTTIWFYFKKMT